MSKSIPEEQYHELAASRGFRLIGPYTGRVKDKVEWECSEGHRWRAPQDRIRYGSGCPYCCDHVQITEKQYHELAKSSGLRFIGPYTGNTMDSVEWQCQEDHKWTTKYGHIKQGHGCPFCAGNTTIFEEQYYELAKNRGFLFIGPYTGNVNAKIEWQCEEGHIWEMSYSAIYHGNCGCPYCSNTINGVRASKNQVAIAELLGAKVNYSPDSLNRYIDCALPARRIAVEYDCWFWHGDKEKRDYGRAQELINDGWRVIAVKANTQIPTLEQLEECISQIDEHPYIELILDWGFGPIAKNVLGSVER